MGYSGFLLEYIYIYPKPYSIYLRGMAATQQLDLRGHFWRLRLTWCGIPGGTQQGHRHRRRLGEGKQKGSETSAKDPGTNHSHAYHTAGGEHS